MQRLSNEDYLETEDFWKDYFDVKFIKENKNNTELWKVINKETDDFVLCNSMLMAFKIAHTACERLEGYQISTDHRNVLNKACVVLGKNSLNSFHIMRYEAFYYNKWHTDKTDRPVYMLGDVNKKEYQKRRLEKEKVICDECEKEYILDSGNIFECEVCASHICKKCLKKIYMYDLEDILSDGVVCRTCCEIRQ